MKRVLIISVAVVALLVGTVFVASAQTPNDQGQWWGCGGWGAGTGGYGYQASPMYALLAQKLGITTDELKAELQSGKSVADVAAAKGVSLDALVEAIEAPMDEMAQIMTRYGYMTGEQVEAMEQWRESMHRQLLEQKGGFTGYAGPGMMRGFGGMMGGVAGPRGGFGGMMGRW